MPAYLRSLTTQRCDARVCARTATQALYNGRNGMVAYYCDKHAYPALDAFRAAHERSVADVPR